MKSNTHRTFELHRQRLMHPTVFPERGSAFVRSRISAASPSIPLRKSTGLLATITRTVQDGPIIGLPSAHGRSQQSTLHPHLGDPDSDAFGFDLGAPDVGLRLRLRCLALIIAMGQQTLPTVAFLVHRWWSGLGK